MYENAVRRKYLIGSRSQTSGSSSRDRMYALKMSARSSPGMASRICSNTEKTPRANTCGQRQSISAIPVAGFSNHVTVHKDAEG